jgi:hypothetical protein
VGDERQATAAMSGDELLQLLDHSDLAPPLRQVWETFRAYLGSGFAVDVDRGAVPSRDLANIYTVRTRIVRKNGLEAAGFEETVQALRSTTEPVRMVTVEAAKHYGIVFLTEDLKRVLGFLYIERKPGSRSLSEYRDFDFTLTGERIPRQH